jgi:hypothetical protein
MRPQPARLYWGNDMPLALERELKRRAFDKGLSAKKGKKTILTGRGRAYVYGTMRKTGWKPAIEKTNR